MKFDDLSDSDTKFDNINSYLTEHFEGFILVGFDVKKQERIILGHTPTQMHEAGCIQLLREALENVSPVQIEVADNREGD